MGLFHDFLNVIPPLDGNCNVPALFSTLHAQFSSVKDRQVNRSTHRLEIVAYKSNPIPLVTIKQLL